MACRIVLEISQEAEDEYSVRVPESPVGEFGPVNLSSGDIAPLKGLCKEIEDNVLLGRKPKLGWLEEIGNSIFDILIRDTVRRGYERSLGEAHRAGQVLRIILKIAEPLQELCWELVYDPDTVRGHRFLSMSDRTTLSRYTEIPSPPPPESKEPLETLRVLAVAAAPKTRPPLDLEKEKYAIRAALNARARTELRVIDHATWEEVQREIRAYHPHIVHFMGHGERHEDEFVILLEDSQHEAVPVTAEKFGELLVGRPIAMVVLNACETGKALSDRVALAGILAEFDIPAVIGMRLPISDPAAILFSDALYTYLLHGNGRPIDEALADARRAIKTRGVYEVLNDLEWTTPVLYMRSQDGLVFDLAEASNEIEPWKSIKEAIKSLGHVTTPESVDAIIDKLARKQGRAIALLAAALGGHPKGRVREGAARALGMIKDELSIRPLTKALKDPVPEVRMRSAESLGRVGNVDAIADLEVVHQGDPVTEVRVTADEAIRQLQEMQTALAEEVLESFRETQQRVQELSRQLDNDRGADIRRARLLADQLYEWVSASQPIGEPGSVISQKRDELNTLLGRIYDLERELRALIDTLVTLFPPADGWNREIRDLVAIVQALDNQVIRTSDGQTIRLTVEERRRD